MRLYLLFITAFLFTSTYGQARFDGYVHDEITRKPLMGAKITLSVFSSVKFYPNELDSSIFKENNYDTRYDTIFTLLQTIETDANGNYFFDNIPSNIYELTAFYATKEVRPNVFEGESYYESKIRITGDCGITKSFELHVTCEYDKTKDSTNCPKCKKRDKVLPIRYGLIPPFQNLDPHYYYNGYCIMDRCHATKHCSRCYLDF